MSNDTTTPTTARRNLRLGLSIAALGIVFGDIGTSPLYTMRECVAKVPPSLRADSVLGILSLIFWALTLIVCVKYLFFITRADNRGEGGIFTLLSLGEPKRVTASTRIALPALIILTGAALLYGDSVITPAITVLSAAEGIRGFIPSIHENHIVIIACVVLFLLFFFQHKGTAAIGRIFGPAMLLWFILIGLIGLWHIIQNPVVLLAINPLYALQFLVSLPDYHAVVGVLGSIVLAITGAEALYADMGHFGRKAIIQAWYFFALPGLLLNYFGQGAYILEHPLVHNPFFELLPAGWPQGLLTVCSVIAAVIASQAVISGAYSITRSAIQLGYFPRLKVTHTSAELAGQIYVPLINTILAILAIVLVLELRSSDRLASAYGVAVTGTMTVTTYAFYRFMRNHWKWSVWKAGPIFAAFLTIDLILFVATSHKFLDGGWLPIAIGAAAIILMHTWKTGRLEIQRLVYGNETANLELADIAKSKNIVRVPGSAVFMVSTPRGTPLSLLHHLKANKCLQKNVVLLTILTEEVPFVDNEERMTLESHGQGVWRATGRYGYMELPDVANLCERIEHQGVPLQLLSTTFYFNREMIMTGGSARMFRWQKNLYAFLSRNARPVKDYYNILPTQIIEIGLPVQL